MKYEVGTFETLTEDAEVDKKPARFGGDSGFGGGNNGGGGNRGGGGGGDRSDGDKHKIKKDDEFSPVKYRLTMWLVLTVIAMTFAGLVGAYMVIAVNKQAEWKPFDLPFAVFASTLLILASSATFELARLSVNRENQKTFWLWLMATTALGAAFVSSQMLAWLDLVGRGYYLSGNPYAGFFYILTVAHAFHLVIGIGALGYLVLKSWQPTSNPKNLFKRQTAAGIVGMYWHSMGALWLLLFGLLALWK